MINTASLQQTLVSIAKDAGKAILEIYHDESAFDRVDFKADDSPLTLADQAAHNVIVAGLEKATPEIPILSEEGKHLPFEERQNWTR
ncbi:MAG: inositol monophosphatase family protein, partial [Bacteroidota bacterium]